MRKRPITALLAALALLTVVPAASFAQTPTPTPTPTATAAQDDGTAAEPPENASEEVKAVYTDYSRDGVIDVCDHARDVLEETLDEIEPDFDRDFPDFREAIEAGIQRHDGNRCEEEEPEATATPTATPDDFTFDDDTTDPSPTPDDGTLPEDDFGDDGGALPPEDGTLPPDDGGVVPESGALPDATPAPPAATPNVAPATAPTPSPTPVVVTRSRTDALLIPGIIIGIALLGAAALAASAYGNRSPRVQHAWSEALYRVRGTWADFSDWLKLGR